MSLSATQGRQRRAGEEGAIIVPHVSQTCGVSSECVAREPDVENILPHVSQTCGLPAWQARMARSLEQSSAILHTSFRCPPMVGARKL